MPANIFSSAQKQKASEEAFCMQRLLHACGFFYGLAGTKIEKESRKEERQQNKGDNNKDTDIHLNLRRNEIALSSKQRHHSNTVRYGIRGLDVSHGRTGLRI
jgi:hypothetical protein